MAGGNKQQSQQSFDPEIKQRLLQVYDTGSQLAQQPFQPYLDATVAPASPAQLQGMQASANLARAGVGQQGVQSAINAASDVAGFRPATFDVNTGANVANIGTDFGISGSAISGLPQVNAMQLGQVNAIGSPDIGSQAVQARDISALPEIQAGLLRDTNLDPYMNQFTDSVVNTALGDIETARQQQQVANRARAVGAGAYGGTGQALLESRTNEAALEQAARTAADLRRQGFESASARAESDINRGMTAGTQNLQAELARQQANQGASLQAQTGSAERAQQAATESARLGQQGQLTAQDLTARNLLANQAQDLTAQQLGLTSELDRQRLNAANQLTAQQSSAQLGLEAARSNQAANLEAALAQAQLESNLALARQQADLDAAGLNLRGAQSLAGLSEAQRGLAFQDAAALEAVGERQRGLAQETLEDRYRRFIEQRDFPLTQFDILRAGAGILPSPITQKTKGSGFSVLGG
tara:strand:- start:5141 stop:6553 length:1413 start_codon:yes stop_codon:yes gene_type:complete